MSSALDPTPAVREALLDLLEQQEGLSPGRGMSAWECSLRLRANDIDANVVVVGRAMIELVRLEQVELLHGGPMVVEALRA